MSGKARDPVLKFFSQIQVLKNGCWQWTGGKYSNGYARSRFLSKEHLVHRWAYEQFIGPIPDDLDCHHVCYNRSCVNPAHLELRTNRDNVLDKDSSSPALKNMNKTHCKRDHLFDINNTLLDKNGWRSCRICHKERERARRMRAKAL